MAISTSDLKPMLRATARLTGLAGTLSPPLMREAARRLGTICLVVVLIKTITFVSILIFGRPFPTRTVLHFDMGAIHEIAHTLSLLAGLGLYWLSRRERLSPSTLLNIGYVYEVISGFQLAFMMNGGPWPADMGPSIGPVAVWATIFALVIPGPPMKVALATGLTMAMEPFTIWLHVQLGMPTPSDLVLAHRLIPLIGLFIFSVVLSRVIYRMSVQLSAATEMGSYRLEAMLGEGGMGEVWRASHRFLARPAAVKLIRSDGRGDQEALFRRFEREAQATAALQSPHTIDLYDFGVSDEGRFYYVMELLDGLDLETMVRRFGPLQPARVVHIMTQICRSLSEAHQGELVHRDIKPANIFVCCYGGAHDFTKVLDFGLVGVEADRQNEADTRLTQEGAVLGTPAYMAPELALEGVATAAVDLYALGCVAFWMLTGRRVFEGDSPMLQITHHVKTEPPRPSDDCEFDVPAALDDIILRCLAKAPEARPASARELAQALDALKLCWSEEEAEQWWLQHMPTHTPQSALYQRVRSHSGALPQAARAKNRSPLPLR